MSITVINSSKISPRLSPRSDFINELSGSNEHHKWSRWIVATISPQLQIFVIFKSKTLGVLRRWELWKNSAKQNCLSRFHKKFVYLGLVDLLDWYHSATTFEASTASGRVLSVLLAFASLTTIQQTTTSSWTRNNRFIELPTMSTCAALIIQLCCTQLALSHSQLLLSRSQFHI